MSAAAPIIQVPGRLFPARADHAGTGETSRAAIRLISFGALGLYGLQRWGTLMRNPPPGGCSACSRSGLAVAGGVPVLRRYSRAVAAVGD